ncbi:MAG: hypothetical protein ABIO61_02800 [Thermomonas sp.]
MLPDPSLRVKPWACWRGAPEHQIFRCRRCRLKCHLDIDWNEQASRLVERARDRLELRKIGSIDGVAVKHRKAHLAVHDAMLLRMHTVIAAWRIVRTNNECLTCLNLID